MKEVNRLFWEKIQEGQLYYNTGRGVGITVKKAEGHNNWMITVDGDSEFAKKVHIKKNAIATAEDLEKELSEKTQTVDVDVEVNKPLEIA